MKFAYFPGCKISHYVPGYGLAVKTVFDILGVELVELEFNCCGYPVRHLNQKAFLLSAARNFALVADQGLELVTPCKCCFGNLKRAALILATQPDLAMEIFELLALEGLEFNKAVEVKHMLQVLRDDLDPTILEKKVKPVLKGLNAAVHYGCHALRPSVITQFDDPVNPAIFEDLLKLTGALPVPWNERLDCCGNPLLGKNDGMSLKLAQRKADGAIKAGADYMILACSHCHIQFQTVANRLDQTIPTILFPQLLGLSMGLAPKDVGLVDDNLIRLIEKRTQTVEDAAGIVNKP